MSGSLAKLAAAIESQLSGKRIGMTPEPLLRFSHLQAASHELYQRYERAEQALPPPHLKRREAINKFRNEQKLNPTEWRMIFSGLADKSERVGPILEESQLFDRVHHQVQERIRQRSLSRRDWLALCFSYFGYESEMPDANFSWCTLRQDIKDGLESVKGRQVREKEWIRIVQQYEDLFTDTAGEGLGEQMFNGEIDDLSVLQTIAQIPDSSWLWRRIFNVLLSRIFHLDDVEFEYRIAGFIALGVQHPKYVHDILSACLSRYYLASFREKPCSILKQAALDNWGSPQMRSRENRWRRHVETDVCAMVVAWFAKEDLEHFFNLLKGDADVDQARLFYWLRFANQMSYTRIVLGTGARNDNSKDFTHFREKNKGRLSCLDGAPSHNNAVLMQIGNYLFVEFSGTGNACFVYPVDNCPFNPEKAFLDIKDDLKQQGRSPKRMLHKPTPRIPNMVGGWLRNFDDELRALGITLQGSISTQPVQPPMHTTPQSVSIEGKVGAALVGIPHTLRDTRAKGGAFYVQLERPEPTAMAALHRLGFKQVNDQPLRFWRH